MVNMMNYIRIGIFLLVSVALTGCTTVGKVAKVIANPDIQVGENDKQPTVVDFILVGEDFINSNFYGDPTPIVIDLYYLRDKSRFLAIDYDSISMGDIKDVMGKAYLDHEEYLIEPSTNEYISEIEVPDKTRFLGVIAHYSDIDNVLWKKVLPIKAEGDNAKILVLAKEREIIFERMKD